MLFEAGKNRVMVKVQGYLRGSDQQVICGRLTDAGTVDLDQGYDESLVILVHAENILMIGGGLGVIKESDIEAIGRDN